jgi:lipoyl(octanoyl) transferase
MPAPGGHSQLAPGPLDQDRSCSVASLGRVPYQDAWDLQRRLVEQRKMRAVPDTVLFLEHPPVITLGRNARPEHLLTPPEALRRLGIDLVETDRGGDVTFHGPGQLMGYLILDLGLIRKDVVWYVRTLEEALIRTAAEFGIIAGRREGMPGVWVGRAKLAALGVHLSRWVTSHGFALNLETDLSFFRHIVPCGIADAPVTSLCQLLGRPVERPQVEKSLARHLGELLGLRMVVEPPAGRERSDELCRPKY